MSRLTTYRGIIDMALLLLVAPLLTYRLAISSTIATWKVSREESKELIVIQGDSVGSQKPTAFKYDDIEMIESGLLLEQLLDGNNNFAVSIIKYTPYMTYNQNGIRIRTAELILGGSFSSLVKTIERIEKSILTCKIISADFHIAKTGNNRRSQLQLSLYIQQICEMP